MTIVRRQPLRELTSLQADMNRLFDTAFAGPDGAGGRWVPPMDLLETGGEYILRADLPGITQEDIALQVEDNVLTVAGARKHDEEQDISAYHRSERPHGAFSRAVTLPKGIDAEAVAASFVDGVLEVRIPKPAQAQPKRIEIVVGNQPAAIEA